MDYGLLQHGAKSHEDVLDIHCVFPLPDIFLWASCVFTHSFLTKPQEINLYWKISSWYLSQCIYRTFLSVCFVWTHNSAWCLQSPLQLSDFPHSYPSNPHKNPAPRKWLFFKYILQMNHWSMRSLRNTSKGHWCWSRFPSKFGRFYLHSCHLHVSLSWRQGIFLKSGRSAHIAGISVSTGSPFLFTRVQCMTLFPLHQDPCVSFWKLPTAFSGCFWPFLPSEVCLHFFQAASHFWLFMPALMGSLHDVSAFDPAPGPLCCRMSLVNFTNLLSIHEGCYKVRPDPSHLVLHGLNPRTTRHHHFYYL